MHHGVVAHFEPLEDLHVLDVEAGEVLKCLHNGSLRGRRRWVVAFGHIQGVVLDVHLRTYYGCIWRRYIVPTRSTNKLQ